jgi:hypothetical protein
MSSATDEWLATNALSISTSPNYTQKGKCVSF